MPALSGVFTPRESHEPLNQHPKDQSDRPALLDDLVPPDAVLYRTMRAQAWCADGKMGGADSTIRAADAPRETAIMLKQFYAQIITIRSRNLPMSSISKAANLMVILFALMCAWVVSSGWKHQVMNSLDINRAGEVSSILSTKTNVNASIPTKDIAPATAIAE